MRTAGRIADGRWKFEGRRQEDVLQHITTKKKRHDVERCEQIFNTGTNSLSHTFNCDGDGQAVLTVNRVMM